LSKDDPRESTDPQGKISYYLLARASRMGTKPGRYYNAASRIRDLLLASVALLLTLPLILLSGLAAAFRAELHLCSTSQE
jgi:hypothetical protein